MSRWAGFALMVGTMSGGCAPDAPRPSVDTEDVATSGRAGSRHVLVIGIDGIRPDVLAEVPTPNLDALAASGVFREDARTGFPTVSGPGWSSFLTGVWPDKHGVRDNSFEGSRYDAYPDFLTRIERQVPQLETFAAADWRPLLEPVEGGPVVTTEVDSMVRYDGYELGWAEADAAVTAAAVDQITNANPNALFVYLGNPDEASHQAASIAAPYRDAIALADRHVGLLVNAVEARPGVAEEAWLVVISTDHGRLEDGDHGGDSAEESTIFFLVSGHGVERATVREAPSIVDVPVTALAHLGIQIDPSWELDGKAVGLGGATAPGN